MSYLLKHHIKPTHTNHPSHAFTLYDWVFSLRTAESESRISFLYKAMNTLLPYLSTSTSLYICIRKRRKWRTTCIIVVNIVIRLDNRKIMENAKFIKAVTQRGLFFSPILWSRRCQSINTLQCPTWKRDLELWSAVNPNRLCRWNGRIRIWKVFSWLSEWCVCCVCACIFWHLREKYQSCQYCYLASWYVSALSEYE